MESGYVYILINQSFFDMIKIGKTVGDPKDRAKQLSTTGVPTPFKVAYSIYSNSISYLERTMHKKLELYRINRQREFFKFPLDEAINLLQRLHYNQKQEDKEKEFEKIDITEYIVNVYNKYLRKSLSSVSIIKKDSRVLYEICLEEIVGGYLIDEHIHRYDLAFVEDDDANYFSYDKPIQSLADQFIKLDPFSMINVACEMFDDDKFKNCTIDVNWEP